MTVEYTLPGRKTKPRLENCFLAGTAGAKRRLGCCNLHHGALQIATVAKVRAATAQVLASMQLRISAVFYPAPYRLNCVANLNDNVGETLSR